MKQSEDADLITDMQALSNRIAHVAAWLALGIATYLFLDVLAAIAPAPAHLKIAAFCAAFLTTSLAAAPFIRFILVMWQTRYEEIRNRLNNTALYAYLLQFWEKRLVEMAPQLARKLETHRSCANLFDRSCDVPASELFETIYNEQYGRLAFVTPVILVLAVVAIETALIVFVLGQAVAMPDQTCAYQILGAIAGTYMFVVGDSVMSARRRSLNISDVYWYALRLVLAVPLGLAIYKVGGDMMGAFVLGTLPIDQFRKMLARYGGANFTLLEQQTQETDQLVRLEGVTGDISAQLALEGITSIEQIVGSDPVSLAIRTGLPFKLLLRLGSQAVVRRHLQMNAGPLAGIGLADAEPVTRLLRDLQARYKMPPAAPSDPAASAALWLTNPDLLRDPVILGALATINDAAAAQVNPPRTPMMAATLLTAFLRIADESYTKFLMANDGFFVCKLPGCTTDDRECLRGRAKPALGHQTRPAAPLFARAQAAHIEAVD